MAAPIKLILTVPPTDLRKAQPLGLPLGHMAYRIGSGCQLLRSELPLQLRGGLMVLSDAQFDGTGEPDLLCRQIIRECSMRGFDGILCDFELRPIPILRRIAQQLDELTARRSWRLYLPLDYASTAPRAQLLVSSAISGGSLELRLQELSRQFQPQRLVLAVDRMAEDFFLPAPNGSGRPLSHDELLQLLERLSPSIFFSHDLCAQYFTYMSRESGAHFVLFDNGASIRRKLDLAKSLGIREGVLAYPQVADLLKELL